MKIVYDRETDSLTLMFRDEEVYLSDEPRPGLILDFDVHNRLISCEILDASAHVERPDIAPDFLKRESPRAELSGAAEEASGCLSLALVRCPVRIKPAIKQQALVFNEAVKISIEAFVRTADVHPIFLHEPSFLVPDGVLAEVTFFVLLRAMREEGVSGLASVTVDDQPKRVLLTPYSHAFSVMFLRDYTTLEQDMPAHEDEPEKDILDLAKQLIRQRERQFSPEDNEAPEHQRASYQEQEEALGQGARAGNIIDFRERLKRSIDKKRILAGVGPSEKQSP